MNLQIAKWGNRPALRNPSELARRLALHDGDTVDARLTADGALTLRAGNLSRAAFAVEAEAEADLALQAAPMGVSVIDELRRGSCSASGCQR